MFGITGDGDDTLWSWHLQLQVDIARPRHELGISQSPEDGVICTVKINYLKDEVL